MGNRERQPHSNAKAPRNWGNRNLGPEADLRLAREVGLTEIHADVSPDTRVLGRTSAFTDKHIGPDGNPVRRGLAENAKKRPDSHTVRTKKPKKDKASEVLTAEQIKKIKGPKELVRLAGSMESKRRQKTSIKPKLHERKHIDEGTVATVIVDEVELDEQRETVVYTEEEENTQLGPLAKTLLPLFAQHDELDPDPLAEESVEEVLERKEGRLPEDKPDWADYGSTRQDHKS